MILFLLQLNNKKKNNLKKKIEKLKLDFFLLPSEMTEISEER